MVSAAVIVVAAQWSDPGGPAELSALGLAAGAYLLWALAPRPPIELPAALVVLGVGLAVGPEGDLELGLFLVVIMVLYVAWHTGSTPRALVSAVIAAGLPWFLADALGASLNPVPWAAACAFTFVLGRNLRRQRMLIDELDATREALADAAVAEERRRIARELHDVAGHTLAAVMLHVTGARHVLRRDPPEAERALLDAERVGRASLDQIRATVAALRTTERGTDPAPAGSADLTSLVEEYRRAGLAVEAELAEDLTSMEGPVGIALHRIAREALANVARHAPGNRVRLSVSLRDGNGDGAPREARLVVADRGRAPEPGEPGGFGLVGMRERARSLGGELSAGPAEDGWRVEAVMPLAPTGRGAP